MALPFTITNLPAGNNPASVLDANYAALGVGINIGCTTGGTNNALALTPLANFPTVSAYQNNMLFSFQAGATSTGLVTAAVAGLAALPVFAAPGVQASAGSLVQNYFYTLMYCASIVGGSGPGFVIINATQPAVPNPLTSAFKNLKIVVASNSTVTFTFDQVVVAAAAGGALVLNSGNFTLSTASNNVVNGYDQVSGALAQATWYAVLAIYNPGSQIAGGYITSNPAAPNLPSGYTYFARLGYIRTAPASTSLLGTIQYGRDAQYVVGLGALTALPVIDSGNKGSISVPTWVAEAVSGFVPPSASMIKLGWQASSGAPAAMIAPNNSYGAITSTTNPPYYAAPGSSVGFVSNIEMLLESSNIYFASSGDPSQQLLARGWKDNL